MSLLTDNFDVGVVAVAEDQLFRMLSFAFINKFSVAMPPMVRLFDQIGTRIDPMRRLQSAESGIVVTYFDKKWMAELEFLTKFPGDKEFTNVLIKWHGTTSHQPIIQRCWRGLSGITNHRTRKGRIVWSIPQGFMEMINELAETALRRPY